MKYSSVIVTLVLFFSPSVLPCEDWRGGVSLSSDALLISTEREVLDNLFMGIELGPAWEREADFRIDDFLVRTTVRWFPPLFAGLYPYFLTFAELWCVDTGYAQFAAPGICLGAGWSLPVGRSHALFIEGGWQFARRHINTSYETTSYAVFYNEMWSAPSLLITIGWRQAWGGT